MAGEPPSPERCILMLRLRLTWGWSRNTVPVNWNCRLQLDNGSIRDVETCFSGQAVVAPKGTSSASVLDEIDLPHEVTHRDDQSLEWRSVTQGNLSMRHDQTQAIPLSAKLKLEANGVAIEHSLEEVLRRGRSHFLRGWLSEAIRVGPLVPIEECTVEAEWLDLADQDVDTYRLQVAQHNGQWAWLSPIWAEV
jgi:hypothetical protein